MADSEPLSMPNHTPKARYVNRWTLFVSCATLVLMAYFVIRHITRAKPFKVVFLGDSYTAGVKDELHLGGFPGRVAMRFPGITVETLAIPGAGTKQFAAFIQANLEQQRPNTFKSALDASDLIVVALGENDYWEGMTAPRSALHYNILIDELRSFFPSEKKCAPVIIGATLARVGEELELKFIDRANGILNSMPWTVLKFDQWDANDLASSDNRHPSAKGYDKIAALVELQISKVIENRNERCPRADPRAGIELR